MSFLFLTVNQMLTYQKSLPVTAAPLKGTCNVMLLKCDFVSDTFGAFGVCFYSVSK